MKKWKRVLSILLAGVITCGLAACGGEASNETDTAASTNGNAQSAVVPAAESAPAEEKDPVLLEWYFRGNGQQEDTDLVESEINEVLKTYPGLEHVSININCFTAAEYNQAVILAQSSGKQMDILNTVSLPSFPGAVEEGSFMPLGDLISDELSASLPQWLWDLGSVDGQIYMVPNYQRAMNCAFIVTPKEYMDNYGDYEKMESVFSNPNSTLDEIAAVFEEYLYAVRAGEGETKYLQSLPFKITSETGSLGYPFVKPYDFLYSDFKVEHGSDQVQYRLTTDAAKEAYALAARWYDEGLVHPDMLTINPDDFISANMLNPASFITTFTQGAGEPELIAEKMSASYGFDVVALQVQNQYYISNTWAAGGNGVSASSEYPEEAIAFIEAINTGTDKGKEIYNLAVYGIEGKHYTRDANDPDRIETIEYATAQGGLETTYAGLKWIIGNTFNAYKNQAVVDGNTEIDVFYNESPDTITSENMGLTISIDNVSTQVEMIDAVAKEYKYALLYGATGAAGWEALYDEFYNKVMASGLEDVMADFQGQVDAFNASK